MADAYEFPTDDGWTMYETYREYQDANHTMMEAVSSPNEKRIYNDGVGRWVGGIISHDGMNVRMVTGHGVLYANQTTCGYTWTDHTNATYSDSIRPTSHTGRAVAGWDGATCSISYGGDHSIQWVNVTRTIPNKLSMSYIYETVERANLLKTTMVLENTSERPGAWNIMHTQTTPGNGTAFHTATPYDGGYGIAPEEAPPEWEYGGVGLSLIHI